MHIVGWSDFSVINEQSLLDVCVCMCRPVLVRDELW